MPSRRTNSFITSSFKSTPKGALRRIPTRCYTETLLCLFCMFLLCLFCMFLLHALEGALRRIPTSCYKETSQRLVKRPVKETCKRDIHLESTSEGALRRIPTRCYKETLLCLFCMSLFMSLLHVSFACLFCYKESLWDVIKRLFFDIIHRHQKDLKRGL